MDHQGRPNHHKSMKLNNFIVRLLRERGGCVTKTFRIMRITAILLLACSLHAAATGFAQKISLSAREVHLEKVFKEIKRQSAYHFWYENTLLKDAKKVNVELKDASIEQVLNLIFEGQSLTYDIVGKTIVIKKSHEMNRLLAPEAPPPPPIELRGKVLNEFGDPVSGASVLIKGTKTGVQTNGDGEFVLPDVPDNAILIISSVGHETQQVAVNKRNNLVIQLKIEVSGMEETVVVAYGTSKVKDVTGSISRLGQKDIRNAPMGATLQSLLQGKAAGVNVAIQSASPTSPMSVVIRGASSLNGNNQPLWVIDGVPDYSGTTSGDITNTLYNLNINDVESIDILKDASATALYGSRASNGVVIVTTKRGREGIKPTIELSTRWGLQTQNLNGYKYMEAPQYIDFAEKAAREEAFGRGVFDYFTRLYLDEQAFFNLNTSEFDRSSFAVLPGAFYEGNTNWMKEMTHNPWNQQHDLSLRGGTQNIAYYVSLNHRNVEGIVKSGKEQQFGGTLNLEAKIRKGLKFGLNLNGNSRETDNKDYMMDVLKKIRPDIPVYNPDGTLFTRDAYTENPYTTLLNKRAGSSQYFRGSLFLEVDILRGLVFRTQYNTTFQKGETLNYTRRGSTFNYDGTRFRSDDKNQTKVWENTLTYARNFGKHDITALAGASAEKYSSLGYSMTATNFPDDDILNDFGSGAVRGALTESYSANSLLSQFARAHYKYNERYIISGTIRRDGSSRFGPDKRWGIFPSAAVAWIISEEDFIKNTKIFDIVSYLKLRASRGLAGSQNLGNYAWRTNVGSSRYNEAPAITPSSVGNTELQWEEALMTDIGLDFGLWNERIRGTIGVYEKLTRELIYSRPLPPSTSFTSISSNVGSVKNKGIEFDVKVDVIKSKDITFTLDANAAKNVNRVMKINGVVKELSFGSGIMITKEGERTGQWFGFQTAGRLFTTAEEIIALQGRSATGTKTFYRNSLESPGDLIFIDQNKDGVINNDDKVFLGSSDPKLYGGFGATLVFKGFYANATFIYAYGHKRNWAMPMADVGYVGNYNHSTKIAGKSATLLSPYEATIPRMTQYGDGGNSTFSDFWLFDASYVRLNALNFGYRLPARMFKQSLIQGIDLSLQATNLFTLTSYPGFDPQGNWSSAAIGTGMGVDNSAYPAARNFNLGAKFTFK